ncbi:MAG: FHA domain-containing protein [Variovorax sp.]|nr:MAG: FHA domain-containing protein [Variovorax sp.]
MLEWPTISNFHAMFLARDDVVSVRDLHSTNGVLVNMHPVSSSLLLHGDVVRLADVEMHFARKALYNAEDLPDLPSLPEPTGGGGFADTVPGVLDPAHVPRSRAPENRIGGSAGAWWFGDGVAFTLLARGREIPAYITADALHSHFAARIDGPDGAAKAVAAYEAHHVAINVVAWALFARTELEPIWIRTADFGA